LSSFEPEHGRDPQAWLAHVLAKLPDHPAKRIDEVHVMQPSSLPVDCQARRAMPARAAVSASAHLLKNRFYIGEVIYWVGEHRGEHAPILGRDRETRSPGSPREIRGHRRGHQKDQGQPS
jgi:IS66 C-terminal element